MKGLFITFEGPDGAGKTTQMKMLGTSLEDLGKSVILTREPGGPRISEAIRTILLDPTNGEMVSRTEAFLYAAARAQHVEEIIRPALKKGKVVLCDRFIDSTIAYQGFGRGIDIEFLKQVNLMAINGLTPDLTFILDIDPAVGIHRISQKRQLLTGEGIDRIEREHIDFHIKVRKGFSYIAGQEPYRCRVIDAGRDEQAIHAEIYRLTREVL